MIDRHITDERGRRLLIKFIEHQELPFTAKISEGTPRSIEQNRLQWLWASEAAAHRKDTTPREVQAEWKLLFGVPILCADDERFAAAWARADRKLPYSEQKELMNYLSLTSLMTSKQLSEYLRQIYQFYAENGIELTDPEDLRYQTIEEARQ